jgi:hypothetical protein
MLGYPPPPADRTFSGPQIPRDLAGAVSAGVYPPRCAYLMPRHTPATSRRHHPIPTS